MTDREWLADEFERSRGYLQSVAYRMLGSLSEADDAVQEAWLRLERVDGQAIADLRAWLTTVVGRICLDMLRARRTRDLSSDEVWLPQPIISTDLESNPEESAVLADSVGLALLVVLETLSPAERLAFVLHDVFGVEFDEIGRILEKSPVAARQLASRARRRIRDARMPSSTIESQRRVVDAFLAASRAGDFDALLEILHPDVVFRVDTGGRATTPAVTVGATAVAQRVLQRGSRLAHLAQPIIVNGAAGVMVGPPNQPFAVVGFTIADGRVAAMHLVTDRDKIRVAST